MPKCDNRISGRLALVTGASGGVRCSLVLTGFSKLQVVQDLAEELASKRTHDEQKVTAHRLDTGDPAAVEQLFRDIKSEYGQDGPDILVSNAGHGKQEFDHTINVNLRASFVLSKLSIPHMEAQGWGRIVFVSSIAAIGGGINACHYAASKGGLSAMMRNLAAKHAKSGVTVNDVAPAMIGNTGMIPSEEFVAGTPGDVKNIPVGRLGTPEECAGVITMCCKTGYLTGQSILLSGGLK
ncbi:3-oxoacyl-reductase [Xylariaceae sp. FL0594]|nr:3-oxoacyl-reductase [Xylariaceae sp. FL0594]